MQLVRDFFISQVNETNVRGAIFELELSDTIFNTIEKRSSMILDAATCSRHNLPMHGLAGAQLVCSFETYEPVLSPQGHAGPSTDRLIVSRAAVFAEVLEKDDLPVRSVERTETIRPSNGVIRSDMQPETLFMLELSTYFSVKAHGRQRPYPFYSFFLKLDDKEYEEIRVLSPTTIFKLVEFHLA